MRLFDFFLFGFQDWLRVVNDSFLISCILKQFVSEIFVPFGKSKKTALEKIKKAQKSGEVTEDDLKRHEVDIQKSTDEAIALIVKIVEEKEKEIMTI